MIYSTEHENAHIVKLQFVFFVNIFEQPDSIRQTQTGYELWQLDTKISATRIKNLVKIKQSASKKKTVVLKKQQSTYKSSKNPNIEFEK